MGVEVTLSWAAVYFNVYKCIQMCINGSIAGQYSPWAKLPPAFLASLVMLMLNSTEGAATVDLINKYTFYTILKSVISLCI